MFSTSSSEKQRCDDMFECTIYITFDTSSQDPEACAALSTLTAGAMQTLPYSRGDRFTLRDRL